MQNQGKTLNQTFIPKTILRKTELKSTNPLIQKNNFEKTHGNVYVQLDPPEIKFNGYEINKLNTLTFKIINKAPIPQRFNILPPTETHFAIKVNKKGNVPSGMYETVQVTFKATEYKYLYDVVKINTETENFIVPLYAYPSIPNINTIFPKMIDFGNIELKQTESFLYPINNPTPIDFKFDFLYKKECAEIMINPLSGVLPGNGQTVVQIAFIPGRKVTYSAEVYFQIQQFDFQPIYIQIIGSGKEKQMSKTFKRLKSSKLMPIKQKEDDLQKQKDRMNQTQTLFNQKVKDPKKSFVSNVRKISSKINYPKLLSATVKQKTIRPQQSTILANEKTLNGSAVFANQEERRFLSRFNKVQEIDKQKEIRFAEYLGDKAMTEQQLQLETSIVSEMHDFRQNLLRTQCQTRYNPEKNDYAEVEYKKVPPKKTTWDENKNDHIYERKAILDKFVTAASKVIESRRIKKRFQKIRQFLSGCSSKDEVAKKVEVSYQKSLDANSLTAFHGDMDLEFNVSSIEPSYFCLQFAQGKEKFNDRVFKPQGKPEFDDLTALDLIEEYESQKMAYSSVTFPPQFLYLNKIVPENRVSGEQQFSVKSSSLPMAEPIELPGIVAKAFDVPNHYFIYEKENLPLFKQYNPCDQKDPSYLFAIDEPVEDEFQGWSKGDFDVLKSKLLKNTGLQYSTSSAYNYSSYRNNIAFLGDITKNLPQFIDRPMRDDQISDDDSDDEKYQEPKIQKVENFLEKIEANPEVKARRAKKETDDEQKRAAQKIQKNIEKDKFKKVTQFIEKTRNINKMVEQTQNVLIA